MPRSCLHSNRWNSLTKTVAVAVAAFPQLALLLSAATPALAEPVTTHPRLWIRSSQIPALQARLSPSNPMYTQGLAVLVQNAKDRMDGTGVSGNGIAFPQAGNYLVANDPGGNGQQVLYIEDYAYLFAFMSLISPTTAEQAAYRSRAHDLILYIFERAVLGVQEDTPFRDPNFSQGDRSRWGAPIAVTVDWIYSSFNAAEKNTIRQVFLRWCGENLVAYNHPTPVGLVNDPQILHLDEPGHASLRNATNNYGATHMRQLALMSIALDAADDPPVNAALSADYLGNTVRSYLPNVTGAWLYKIDYLLRHDLEGGMNPEGMEYYPTPLSMWFQTHLALRTSGNDDPGLHGPQVMIQDHPFLDAAMPAFLHHLPQNPVYNPGFAQNQYQPAWYGDGERFYLPDFIRLFGFVSLLYEDMGRTDKTAALRWLLTNTPPGGATDLYRRGRDILQIRDSILYFMLFDPNVAAPGDPRPSLPLDFYNRGLGRIVSRTAWSSSASMMSYHLGWSTIDHQSADGNMFDFHRKGEWLTKERTGYGVVALSSDYHNTLSLQNTPLNQPFDITNFRSVNQERGSQYILGNNAGDPLIVAHSFGNGYTYATGDATNLYNTYVNPNSIYNYTDITHASRSILWLKPDHIVVYDRARSATTGRYKRFWLSGPNTAAIEANLSTFTTPGGQKLFVRTLLPANAQISTVAEAAANSPPSAYEPRPDFFYPSEYDVMHSRLLVEAPGGPASTRFLHVLQGADAGSTPGATSSLTSSAGTAYEGAIVDDRAVLFRVDLDTPFTGLSYSVPSNVSNHWVTGLTPNAPYTVQVQNNGPTLDISIGPGGTEHFTDDGGVLVFGGSEPAIVSIVGTDSSSSEAASDPATFTISRSGSTANDLSVSYSLGGNAINGVDYGSLSGTVIIPAGSASTLITVVPIDDSLFEGTGESAVVTLSPGPGYYVSLQTTATATIGDNDPPPGGTLQFGAATFSTGEASGSAAVLVTRSGGSYGPVSVRCYASNGTATGADYSGNPQTLSWTDGDTTPRTCTIQLFDDLVYEGNETIHFTLSSVSGEAVLGSPSTATLDILEDEAAPIGSIRLSASTFSVSEGIGSATLSVERIQGSSGTVSIDFATTSGTATAGSDYATTSGTLSWAHGDTASKSIVIPIVSDAAYEGANETFTVTLSNPGGGASLASPSSAILTILDDDPQPQEYDVGDGQPYPSIASVPWESLGAGSVVRIHWRSQPFRERILLSSLGTATQPIRVVGVAGPNGELPVLDASSATTSSGLHYPNGSTVPARSLVAISRDQLDSSSFKPGYVEIDGIELANAKGPNTYTDASGTLQTYSSSAAAILIEGADNITIRNCVLRDSGRGIEITSGSTEPLLSRSVALINNSFSGNSFNVNAEALGFLLDGNRLASTVGTNGQNVRDRSAASVIRYNWIEGSPSAFLLDLVDSTRTSINSDPGYTSTFVYGNVLRNSTADGSNLVHYGGDPGGVTPFRTGTLYFFHNTVTINAARSFTRLFSTASASATIDVRNNIAHAAGGTAVQILHTNGTAGTANLGNNWLSSGWATGGTVNYSPSAITTGSNPGFVDLANANLQLLATGSAVNGGAALSPNTIGVHDVTRQHLTPHSTQLRSIDTTADLGAFEYAPPATATPSPTSTSTTTSTPTPTSTFTSTATATETSTLVATSTPTSSATRTPSETPTSSSTPTDSATATPTSTASETPSASPTPSNSPTDTSTPTSTTVSSETPTQSPTDTPSETPTTTSTETPTLTATMTPSPSATADHASCPAGNVMAKARLKLRATPFKLKLKGEVVLPPPWPSIDPLDHGIRVRIADSHGIGLDFELPAGIDAVGTGWKVNSRSTKWTYQDRSGSVGGITKAVIADGSSKRPGLVTWSIKGKGGSIVLPDPTSLTTVVLLGAEGACAVQSWNGPEQPSPHCSGDDSRIQCR